MYILPLQVLLMPEEDWQEYKREFGTVAEARVAGSDEPAAGVLGRATLQDPSFTG